MSGGCDGEVSAGPSGERLITRSDDGYYGSLWLATAGPGGRGRGGGVCQIK